MLAQARSASKETVGNYSSSSQSYLTCARATPTTGSSCSTRRWNLRAMSAPKASVQVTGIDHIVLRVKDPVASVDWYSNKLGLEPCRLEEYKQGKVPFPSVRITPTFLIDFMPLKFGLKGSEGELADPAVEQTTVRHPNNVDHFCLTVGGDDIEAVRKQLTAVGVEAEKQFDGVVVRRFGAQGNADSIYLRDLDNNVVELRTYGGSGQGGEFTSKAT